MSVNNHVPSENTITTDEEIMRIIISIMDISDEPENLKRLHNWVDETGIDEVFTRIIRLHTTYTE